MEEENGLTLIDIFKVIFKRIWWLVGAAALCVIASVLIMHFWYNKSVQYYSITYEILYPDSASGKYPDGKDFVIADSIALSTLTDIVENSEELNGVDVSKMVENDDIEIKSGVAKMDDGTVTKTYTLTVSANCFKNDEQAVDFLKAVANYPVDRINSSVQEREYELYLTTYDLAQTYTDKITALSSQKEYLQSSYTSLMAYDKSIDIRLAELRTLFTSVQKQSLLDRIEANYYVLDVENYIANSDHRIKSLEDKIEDNMKIIDALKEARKNSQAEQSGESVAVIYSAALYEQDVITNAYDYRIAALIAENATMQNEIDNINVTLDAIEKYTKAGTEGYALKQEFDGLLEEYRAELAAATTQLKTTTIELYRQNSRVIFAGNKVKKQGGVGIIMSAIVGLLAGAVIAGIVICIIDLPKYKRAKLAAANRVAAAESEDKIEEPAPQEANPDGGENK